MKYLQKTIAVRTGAFLLCLLLMVQLAAVPVWAQEGETEDETTSDTSGVEGEGENEGEEPPEPAAEADGDSMFSPSFAVNAGGVYLVNEQSGLVVYEKDADVPQTSASLVKMMTCILVMENIDDIDGTTITMENWVNDWLYGKNASTADIRAGETLSVRELLYAMLLPSANEAALMVAGYIARDHLASGSAIAVFAEMMNEKARALGCTNTTFVDPNGLGEGNQTTPRDMYLILQEFSKYDLLREICQTDLYEMAQHEAHSAPYNIFTTNRLMVGTSPYYTTYPVAGASIKAAKTGSLGEWQNFATYAEYEGLGYYCVVLNAPNEADDVAIDNQTGVYRPALDVTGKLLSWVFERFTLRSALDTTQAIKEVSVQYSTEDDVVKLLPADDLMTLLPVDTDDSAIRKSFDVPDTVEAPVKQGDIIGSVTLSVAGQVIGTSDLMAAKDVERNDTLYRLEQVQAFFSTTAFKLIVGGVVLAVLVYIALMVFLNQRKKRYRNPYSNNSRRRR